MTAAVILTAAGLVARVTFGGGEQPPDLRSTGNTLAAIEPLPSTSPHIPTELPKARQAGVPSASRDTPAPPSARTVPASVPERGAGTFTVAPGESDIAGHGALVTYSVAVEDGLPIGVKAVARVVDRVLGDRRGWTAVDPRALRRVENNPMVQIRLTSPATTDELCAPLDTGGRLSCRNGSFVVLNAWRWINGADAYRGDLRDYRRYMINHEFGHALGHGHRDCPRSGAAAPVMLQQTKGLEGCTANPWPVVTNG